MITTRRQLEKARAEVERLRKCGAIKPREVIRLAKAMGRTKYKRGKEPTYVSDRTGWFPLSIPAHPTLKKGTASNILDQIDRDLDRLEQELPEEKGNGKESH